MKKTAGCFLLMVMMVTTSFFVLSGDASAGGAPPAPTDIRVVPKTNNEVKVFWKDGSPGVDEEDEYRVLYKYGKSKTWDFEKRVGANPGQDEYSIRFRVGKNTPSQTTYSPGSTWYFTVRASNSQGVSPFSPTVEAELHKTAPAPPSKLRVKSVSNSTVELEWQDNSQIEYHFEVFRKAEGGQYQYIGSTRHNGSASFEDWIVQPGEKYYYKVQAFNFAGSSAFSNEVSVTVPSGVPAAPTDLKVLQTSPTGSGGWKIVVEWRDNSAIETSCELWREAPGGTYADKVMDGLCVPKNKGVVRGYYMDPFVQAGQTWTYKVLAYNNQGSSPFSNRVPVTIGSVKSPTTTQPPAAPTGLSATPVSPGAVELLWTDNSAQEQFVIERRTAGGSFAPVGTSPQDWPQYVDTGLTPGNRYFYRVKASNSAGDSSYTAELAVMTSQGPAGVQVPGAPSNMTATAVAPDTIELTWQDTANNEDRFVVQRKAAGGSYSDLVAVRADTSSYLDTGVATGGQYFYRVAAENAAGASSFSNEASALTQQQQAAPTGQFASASQWAVPELQAAQQHNLTTPQVMSDFQTEMTREEFCELVVKLYEAMTGNSVQPVSPNPFSDTSNPEILKANALGIVEGVGGGRFAPHDSISRQEISVMLVRALTEADPGLVVDTSGVGEFADEQEISGWAIDHVRLMHKHGIMKGVGNNTIDPLGQVTREQGIVLVKRTFETF